MATKLKKPLSREMPRRAGKRNWIVTLDPGAETITVKEKGLRTSYEITVEAVFMAAAKIYAARAREEKSEEKRQRRIVRRSVLRGKDTDNVPGRGKGNRK